MGLRRNRTGSHAANMDGVMRFVLELYRAAQETSAEEFQTLALRLLDQLVPFRSATWTNISHTREQGTILYGMQLFNEPEDLYDELPGMNRKHSTTVETAAAQPGVALALYTPQVYSGRDQADMRDYIRRFGHENNLVMTDLQPGCIGEWISLYRPEGHDHFSESDRTIATLLTPHLIEALKVNRRIVTPEEDRVPGRGARALIKLNGIVIHCGAKFADFLSSEWIDRKYTRLPPRLLTALQAKGEATAADGTVRVTAQKLGDLLFLTARKLSPLTKLSHRERMIVQSYGSGRSHKEIARDLALAPATIRNYVQNAYRKLGILNKAQLAKLLIDH